MTISKRIASAASGLLVALATPAFGQNGLELSLELPDSVSWSLAGEQVSGAAYSREWVPEGQTPESAEWLVAQQKIPLEGNESASEFLETIFELVAQACTSTSHDGPDRLRIDGVRGAVGHTTCAQRIGDEFGAFMDQAVFVDDDFAYIVTSELRIEPMVVAGVVAFDHSDPDESRTAADAFFVRQELSRALVRDGIRIEENQRP